jgi:SAM-dependent methyltransferase
MDSEQAPYPAKVKYDEQRARKYQQRKPGKDRAELQLVDHAFALISQTHRVLDVPCGGGRVMLHLARKGYNVTGADFSEGMLRVAREAAAQSKLRCPVERQDIEHLTYAGCGFDTIVCFRLFHHFHNSELRQRVVRELCRVAARYVVLSYFTPYSPQSLKRKLTGTDTDRFATSLKEVKSYFTAAGFRLVKDFSQMPLVHTLHLAVFERIDK